MLCDSTYADPGASSSWETPLTSAWQGTARQCSHNMRISHMFTHIPEHGRYSHGSTVGMSSSCSFGHCQWCKRHCPGVEQDYRAPHVLSKVWHKREEGEAPTLVTKQEHGVFMVLPSLLECRTWAQVLRPVTTYQMTIEEHTALPLLLLHTKSGQPKLSSCYTNIGFTDDCYFEHDTIGQLGMSVAQRIQLFGTAWSLGFQQPSAMTTRLKGHGRASCAADS